MLEIVRKIGESLVINNNIEVIVAGIDDTQVKLKVLVSDEVSVYPKEVYVQIREATKEAVETASIETLKKIL